MERPYETPCGSLLPTALPPTVNSQHCQVSTVGVTVARHLVADADEGGRGRTRYRYFGPATKAAVAQWQSYHELPSTGFWGPASRSTVQKLGLQKLATKATSAVDDPMGVNAARPRPLVPWSTVPVSTTTSTKQLVS